MPPPGRIAPTTSMPVARRLNSWMSVAVVGVLVAYPLLVYFGLGRFGVRGVGLSLIVVCALRLALSLVRRDRGLPTAQLLLIGGGGILLAGASVVGASPKPMLHYPVVVNGAMMLLFAWSLARPPTVVERLARLRDPELPPEGVRYTRGVTIAWVTFFVVNGGAALYTALYASLETWALYNGLIAYILIGVMFGTEFLIRAAVMARLRR